MIADQLEKQIHTKPLKIPATPVKTWQIQVFLKDRPKGIPVTVVGEEKDFNQYKQDIIDKGFTMTEDGDEVWFTPDRIKFIRTKMPQ